MTLGELREKTGIKNENVLNHDLLEMRRVWIIKKMDKNYHLTKYGAILYESIGKIKAELSAGNDLFTVRDKESSRGES